MAHIALEKASGVLTVTGNFSANDTVIVGGVTYKFETTTAAANDIDVGADAETSLANLAAAINGDGEGDGTDYHAGTSTVPAVVATSTATTLTITARMGGSDGNNVEFREGVDGGTTFSITTAMANGSGGALATWIDDVLDRNQVNAELQAAFLHLLNAPLGTA